MKALKSLGQRLSVLCIIAFLVILGLWVTNNPILLHGTVGFLLWGLSIAVGGTVSLLMKKHNYFDLLAKITLTTTVLSTLLLILTGVIYVTTSSMP